MDIGTSPGIVTSRRSIVYRQSKWKVHQFQVWSGELICKVAVLRMKDSLLLWVGIQPELTAVALGVPRAERAGIATTLLGQQGVALAMARRLAAALKKPVYVCCGCEFDRFNVRFVEAGVIAQIKSRPELLNYEES